MHVGAIHGPLPDTEVRDDLKPLIQAWVSAARDLSVLEARLFCPYLCAEARLTERAALGLEDDGPEPVQSRLARARSRTRAIRQAWRDSLADLVAEAAGELAQEGWPQP